MGSGSAGRIRRDRLPARLHGATVQDAPDIARSLEKGEVTFDRAEACRGFRRKQSRLASRPRHPVLATYRRVIGN